MTGRRTCVRGRPMGQRVSSSRLAWVRPRVFCIVVLEGGGGGVTLWWVHIG